MLKKSKPVDSTMREKLYIDPHFATHDRVQECLYHPLWEHLYNGVFQQLDIGVFGMAIGVRHVIVVRHWQV